jgi:glycerate dehydrogenase
MNDPILEAPRTLLTPHTAWQTAETFRRAARISVDNILAYFNGDPVNVVNPDALKVSRHRTQRS